MLSYYYSCGISATGNIDNFLICIIIINRVYSNLRCRHIKYELHEIGYRNFGLIICVFDVIITVTSARHRFQKAVIMNKNHFVYHIIKIILYIIFCYIIRLMCPLCIIFNSVASVPILPYQREKKTKTVSPGPHAALCDTTETNCSN